MLANEEDTGFAVGELEFHNVSQEPDYDVEEDEHYDPLTPEGKITRKIQLSRVFLEAFESQGSYLFMFMPITKEGNKMDILGSVVCQEPSTRNLIVNFYTQTLEEEGNQLYRDYFP